MLSPLRNGLLLLIGWILAINSFAQQDHDNYRHGVINHPTLGRINYHVDTINAKVRQPVLLWLDGSGCLPIRTVVTDGKNCCLYLNSIMIDEDSLARHYHIILVSKPGIPYRTADTLRVKNYEEFRFGDYVERERSGIRCGPDYNGRNSLNWRAEAAAAVLDEALKQLPVDPRRILVAGHSEGAPVAAKIATLSRHVTHVGCFAGPGLSQFYDFILTARQKARAGEWSPEAAQSHIDTLMTTFAAIERNPTATDKFWEGHTYKRWHSYTEPMIGNLLKLQIPVYVAVGTNDANTTAENADVIPIAFVQARKTNLTYRACPSCDHWLNDTRSKQNRWPHYINEFLQLTSRPTP